MESTIAKSELRRQRCQSLILVHPRWRVGSGWRDPGCYATTRASSTSSLSNSISGSLFEKSGSTTSKGLRTRWAWRLGTKESPMQGDAATPWPRHEQRSIWLGYMTSWGKMAGYRRSKRTYSVKGWKCLPISWRPENNGYRLVRIWGFFMLSVFFIGGSCILHMLTPFWFLLPSSVFLFIDCSASFLCSASLFLLLAV